MPRIWLIFSQRIPSTQWKITVIWTGRKQPGTSHAPLLETSTWADGGRKFGELMEKATGGKVKVNIYAADQLTNGNQSEGIQALMNGDPVQISMHSNLIYSAFDPRFNVVSLPFVYDSYDDADAKFDGEAGEKLKEILGEYGTPLHGYCRERFP